jgi:hypothetical protein
MNKHIVVQAVLGGCVGALTASSLYGVTYATGSQGGSGWLPGALAIAGATFVPFFLLFLLEFTSWGTLRSAKGQTKPLP